MGSETFCGTGRWLRWMVAVGALAVAGGPTAGCKKKAPEEKKPLDTREKAAALGKKAAGELMGSLGGRLKKAMQQGGPAAAIEVCAGEAQPLTAKTQAGLPTGVKIKRTSLRLRNPKNAPDAEERRILGKLAKAEKSGEPLPEVVLERWNGPEGAGYRYYRPIRMVGLCLVCHGPAKDLAPVVRDALAKRYPGDRATGYGSGALRGIISVTIPDAALK